MKAQMLFCLLGFIVSLMSITHAQTTDNTLTADDGTYWTLPMTECNDDNICEIRVSPQGTIYSWDMVNFLLYVSQKNADIYDTYDLTEHSQHIIASIDFVPYDEEGYVVFFSPNGASRALTRYELATGNLDLMQFPEDYDLVGCNRYSAVNQRELRLIFPLGLDGHLVACTDSPQNRPVIHIIDVNTLNIEQSLDIGGQFSDIIQPSWQLMAGLDGKIYAVVINASAIFPDLPPIDYENEEIALIYDTSTNLWEYQIISSSLGILVSALPDGTIYVRRRLLNQYSPSFELIREIGNTELETIPQHYIGITLDGNIFLSQGVGYGNILVSNISDYPLIDVEAD